MSAAENRCRSSWGRVSLATDRSFVRRRDAGEPRQPSPVGDPSGNRPPSPGRFPDSAGCGLVLDDPELDQQPPDVGGRVALERIAVLRMAAAAGPFRVALRARTRDGSVLEPPAGAVVGRARSHQLAGVAHRGPLPLLPLLHERLATLSVEALAAVARPPAVVLEALRVPVPAEHPHDG